MAHETPVRCQPQGAEQVSRQHYLFTAADGSVATIKEMKMNRMLCGYRDDPRQWGLEETAADRHGKRLDEHTEGLLFDLERVNGFAHRLNSDYELGYGDLLPELMQALASWSGSSNGHKGSAELMPKLHAILFRHLRDTVAESEVE